MGSVNDKAALKVPGVLKVVTIDTVSLPPIFKPLGGVAVIATNTWAAMEGRRALEIDWDMEPAGANGAPGRGGEGA